MSRPESRGWAEVPLGRFTTLQRGFDITKAEQADGPYPVISSSGLKSRHADFMVRGPGVIIGRKGTLGTAFYVDEDYWPHDTTLWVKNFHGNDPRFAYYLLKSLGLERYDCGASNPTLNRNHIHSLPVIVPSTGTQVLIAATLSAYDDLIENNTRRIAILEEMARALYQEWFVHYRFPGHEHVPLVDSTLGRIPEGWEVKRLSDFADTQYGYTTSATNEVNGPQFLRGMDINKRTYIDWSTVPYCQTLPDDVGKFRLCKGDILIVRMADPGKVGIVEEETDAVFASYLVRIRFDQAVLPPGFVFQMLSGERYQGHITGASSGTTRKSIPAPAMTVFDFALPGPDVLERYEDVAGPMRALLGALVRQNANLRTTRDLLLPKLISGEIDVSAISEEPIPEAAD